MIGSQEAQQRTKQQARKMRRKTVYLNLSISIKVSFRGNALRAAELRHFLLVRVPEQARSLIHPLRYLSCGLICPEEAQKAGSPRGMYWSDGSSSWFSVVRNGSPQCLRSGCASANMLYCRYGTIAFSPAWSRLSASSVQVTAGPARRRGRFALLYSHFVDEESIWGAYKAAAFVECLAD